MSEEHSADRRLLATLGKCLLALALIGAAGAGGFWSASRTRNAAGEERHEDLVINGLSIARSSLSLGEVWEEDTPHPLLLPVRNVRGGPVDVEEFIPSCNCVSVTPTSIRLEPGEARTIRVDVDLLQRSVADTRSPTAEFAIEVTAKIKGSPANKTAWRLRGVIKRRITLDDLSLNFGEAVTRGETPPTRRLRATAHVAVDRVSLRITPPVCNARVVRDEANPPQFTLFVTPKPGLPAGPFKAKGRVELMERDGAVLHGASFDIIGDVQPEARVLPARVLLPPTPVGQTAESVIVLRLPRDPLLTLDHWETDREDITVVATGEEVTDGRAFRVSYRMTKEGDLAGQVKCVLRRGDRTMEALTVQVAARGVRHASESR